GDPGGRAGDRRHRRRREPRRRLPLRGDRPAHPGRAMSTIAVPELAARPIPERRGRRLPYVPLAIIAVFVLAGLLAPLLQLSDPLEQSLRLKFRPPVWEERGTWAHPLGT